MEKKTIFIDIKKNKSKTIVKNKNTTDKLKYKIIQNEKNQLHFIMQIVI